MTIINTQTNDTDLTMSQAVQKYISYCRIDRGFADRTIAHIEQHLRIFIAFYGDSKPLGAVNYELISLFREQIVNTRTRKQSSHNIYVATLRSFFRFCRLYDLPSRIHPERIMFKKEPESDTPYFTRAEIERMEKACDVSTLVGLRDRAVIVTLFMTGLRVSELLSLTRDIFQQRPDKEGIVSARISGKGGKIRTVFFAPRVIQAVKDWLKVCPNKTPYIFTSVYVRREERLNSQQVLRIVKMLGSKAGIRKKRCSPHIARHGFATELMEKGVHTRYIMELMGHSALSSVQRYTHVNEKVAREKYAGVFV